MTKKSSGVDNFTNKEVYLQLFGDLDKKIDDLKSYIQKHIDWCKETSERYIPEFSKLQEQFIHICNELPDKGFCGKVDKMYDDLYPKNEESIPDKMKTLWYDRKMLKFILATSIGALIIGLINFLI